MQRREFVLQEEVRPGPGRFVMAYRDGGFRLLPPDDVAHGGELAVIYDVDVSRDDDLFAANALFNEFYYVNALDDVWPDERAVIGEHFPERGAAVLEVCCGAGRVAGALVRGGNRVTALDNSAECVRYAAMTEVGLHERQARAPVDYLVANAAQLPFPDGAFDIGCCFGNSFGMLFSRRPLVLSELVRVCRRRIILGLRANPGGGEGLQIFATPQGFLEFAQPTTRPGFDRFLEGRTSRTIQGDPRPYGGTVWFLVVELGTDSPAGSRNT